MAVVPLRRRTANVSGTLPSPHGAVQALVAPLGVDEAGIPYRGIHALRHTCGTRLVRETGNLEMAARHLGHSSIETTRVYAKWSDEGLNSTVGGW